MSARTIVPVLRLAALFLLGPVAARGEDRAWSPGATWVYVVGVLEWQNAEDWSSFSSESRKDAALVEFFRNSGVPDERIVYLQDQQATLEGIRKSLGPFLAGAGADSTLFLYYCGHGYKDDGGTTRFANYDAGVGESEAWSTKEIVRTIEESFRGSTAILAADCCTSGGLAAAAESEGGRVPCFVVTSSSANEGSTGDWTFTRGLLDALAGSPLLDADLDGRITFDETGRYLASEMAIYHGQLSTSAATNSFDTTGAVAIASGRRPEAPVGDRVHVDVEGAPWSGKILEARENEYRIRWITIGYDTEASDEWVGQDRVRPIETVTYDAGAAVEVEWKGEWYPATILESKDGVHKIHYHGYSETWDEWVPPGRIRAR